MRIAILHPTYWPEVRRGSERMTHDLAAALAGRGHQVTVLTGTRGPTTYSIEDGFRVVRRRRLPEGLPLVRAYEHHVTGIPNSIRGLVRGDFDVAHALFLTDAWAAARARPLGGPPFVFSLNGIPVREYLVRRRYRLEMLATAIAAASRVSVLSEAAAEPMRRYLLHNPAVLPPGVGDEFFAASADRADVPTILCASSLGDPRKRGELLMSAFGRVRGKHPDARLVLVRTRDEVMSGDPPELCEGAEWISADATADLADAYASAWSTVLPAIDEAFGLVLAESMAAGTPVVAARSGACPELVTNDRVGSLFEPDDEDALVGALARFTAAPTNGEISSACRERAAEYEWQTLVERYEAIYDAAVAEAGK